MPMLNHPFRSARLAAFVAALALVLLGSIIFLGTDRLRRSIRTQLVNQDGEILHAVALAQQFAGGTQTNLSARLQNPADQLALALNISQLKDGVLAVRLFDANGKFVTAFPPYVSETAMSARTLADLKALSPRSRYLGTARLSDLFLANASGGASTNPTPLLEVNIPIHVRGEKTLLAAAQLVLDARNLQSEFAQLDRSLWWQAAAAFLAGGSLLMATLLWAYRRLQRSNALLRDRTARLLRANHELTLAAKTGALGAVTAHLVHGLSNPLANLQDFIASRGSALPGDDEWQDALAATRRMQNLVQEVVRVLGEQNAADQYEITLGELADILTTKLQPAAQAAGVRFQAHLSTDGKLHNRHANLMLLILENLVHNALQVTPPGQRVQVSFAETAGHITCEVVDSGPGFPPHLLKNLFTVCRSTKGGSGLGLAISHQLATHLGAQLELRSSSPAGCVFALRLPRALFTDKQAERASGIADSPAASAGLETAPTAVEKRTPLNHCPNAAS
jgi:signal transduction histidine kinase